MDAPMLSRRRLLQLGLSTTLAAGALLAACGGAPASPAPATKGAEPAAPAATTAPAAQAAPPKGPITIRYYQFMNSVEDVPWWQGGIDRFQKLRPEITIAHEHAPWGLYWEKLAATVAAKTQADAILMVTMYVQQYGRLGAIQSLADYAKADPAAKVDDQWPAVKLANTVTGKWPYQFHYDLSTICVYYNKDMFKKAGLPDPNAKLPEYWTFDEFRDAAIKLTGDGPNGKQWGLANRFSIFSTVDPLLQSHGGGLINEDNTKSLLDKPESIEMMESIVELYVKHKAAPTAQEAQNIPLFESGRVAMEFTNPERSLRYRERIKDFEWDVAPLPVSTKTKVKKNWVHGGGLAMGAATKNPEAAWQFLSYYMSGENLTEMVGKSARGIPGRPSIKQTLLRPDKPPKNMQLFIDAVDWGVCRVVNNFDEFNKLVNPAQDALYDGKRPVAEVFKELTPKIDALLKFS